MTKLFSIGGFTIRAKITSVAYPADHFWLQITSQYESSRNPDKQRDLLGISLSREALTKFASLAHLALGVKK